jgi:nucleoside-diphosphate-sugar epimerase
MNFTLIGGSGFIGSHLVWHLRTQGHTCVVPERAWEPGGEHLGHVIYCAGLTADFRSRHHETVEAHVCKLSRVLELGRYDSFLYLSSTRVYLGAATTYEEAPLVVDPADPDSLYNLTKLTGEARCLAIPRPEVRVARISNAYGRGDTSPNFLGMLTEQARGGRIVLKTSLDSAKDYISVTQAAELLARIALEGRHRRYNVASGSNTTHQEIAATLADIFACQVEVEPGSPSVVFPPIATARISEEFGFQPGSVCADLADMVKGVVS